MPGADRMREYALVLGSNLRPARHFRGALRALPAFGEIARCAGPVRTRDASGGRFLNAVLLLRSDLPHERLRDAVHAIEDTAGRVRGAQAVSLDIDIVASRGGDAGIVAHKPDDLRRDYVRALLDELGFAVRGPR